MAIKNIFFLIISTTSLKVKSVIKEEDTLVFNSNQGGVIAFKNEQDDLSFVEDYDYLVRLGLQMAIKRYTKEECIGSEFDFLDIDSTVNHLNQYDYVTLAKTAIIYPNVQP